MGVLSGIKVVEMGAIGPGPFCCMLLADMGADVVRIDRTEPADIGSPADPKFNLLNRSKRSAAIDLKQGRGIEVVKRLISSADVLVEGFRPGVMERLGLGPDDCLAINPGLVYGRMTGWGQEGPLAQAAGHDINYIALTGVLGAIGPRGGPPIPPLNLVGDYGGGSLFLALGIVSALLERKSSGQGQVVDAAMVDGASTLMTSVYGSMARGAWRDARGENMVDGGAAPWYGVYETLDGKYVSIGSIEARFYQQLLERTGVDPGLLAPQHDRSGWTDLRGKLTAAFKSKTRDEWCALMEGSDVCFSPVLNLSEASRHPHLQHRETLVTLEGVLQPAPAPRFSRTPSAIKGAPAIPGQHTLEILKQNQFTDAEMDTLRQAKVIR